jgi:hypothetical protein
MDDHGETGRRELMAGVLQRFEQRLEGAVTGAFARAFRSAVQPVEIAAALQREVDNSAHILSRDRMLVPNDFTVELSPPDFERLNPFSTTLSDELGTLVKEHVAEQRYTMAGELEISFKKAGHRGDGQRMTETAIRRSSVVLEVNGMKHPLDPPGIVIGRGNEAELKIDDPGISRRHAQIKIHQSGSDTTVTIVDLDSTNGVVLNGHRVATAVVADGSEIRLGNTVIIIRMTEAA